MSVNCLTCLGNCCVDNTVSLEFAACANSVGVSVSWFEFELDD